MPSSFAVVLDTTAPTIYPGAATLDDDNVLYLPYTITEPGIVAAFARSAEGADYEAEIYSNQLIFRPPNWTYGRLLVDLEDEVGNFAHLELDIQLNTVRITTLTPRRATPKQGFKDSDWLPDDYRVMLLRKPR